MNTDETPPANPLAPFHTLPDQQLTLTDIIRTGPHPQPAELPWRPLEPGEKAQPGDECNSEYNTPDDSLDTGWVDCVCSIGKTQAECDSLRFRTRRPLPSAPPIGHAWREFDWPEDSADKDNGAYCNICITCERQFIGHKRRNVCKSCANPVSLNDLEAQGDDEQPAAEPPPATAREWGESAIEDLLNQACSIPQIAIDYIRQISNRCAQAEGELAILRAERDTLRAALEEIDKCGDSIEHAIARTALNQTNK